MKSGLQGSLPSTILELYTITRVTTLVANGWQPQTNRMKTRILVVEDEFLIRLSVTEALVEAGFCVTDAETADLALPVVQSGTVDLLITDIQLPGKMDGMALVRAARAAQPALPVIYITGYPIDRSSNSAREIYIAKPYAPEDLCVAARQLLSATPGFAG